MEKVYKERKKEKEGKITVAMNVRTGKIGEENR